jgi:exopolysaccharide biosynthesis protein
MYPSPAENTWEAKPAKTPSSIYPEGAETFAAKTAIGGGPLLIDKGKFRDSFVEELFNGASGIGPDTNQPRTAIGVTADKNMILFVCEGRQMTEGVAGLTTADVANVLLDLGCVEAINLDGGGSSCMLVNGKATIKVSDGSQRAVASTIMIK